MDQNERIEMVSAILTASHIVNTSRTEENFHEIINLFTKYYTKLNRILPKGDK